MIQNFFDLEIITPHSTEHLKVQWVEIESPTGSFLVGPDHTPLVSIIKKKSLLLYKTEDDKEHTVETYGGIFKVANNQALALLDQ